MHADSELIIKKVVGLVCEAFETNYCLHDSRPLRVQMDPELILNDEPGGLQNVFFWYWHGLCRSCMMKKR